MLGVEGDVADRRSIQCSVQNGPVVGDACELVAVGGVVLERRAVGVGQRMEMILQNWLQRLFERVMAGVEREAEVLESVLGRQFQVVSVVFP